MGAIAGDIIRSVYEHTIRSRPRTFSPPVSSLCPLHRRQRADGGHRRRLSSPGRSYRDTVREWGAAIRKRVMVGAFGNGCRPAIPDRTTAGERAAMRVGPVGWAFTSEEEVLAPGPPERRDHPRPSRGDQGRRPPPLAIYLARTRTLYAVVSTLKTSTALAIYLAWTRGIKRRSAPACRPISATSWSGRSTPSAPAMPSMCPAKAPFPKR